MSVPVADDFVFTPAQETKKGEVPTIITVPSLVRLPRTYAMVEAAADGNEAKFVVLAIRGLPDQKVQDQLRELPAAEWDRFLTEWRGFSKISLGE